MTAAVTESRSGLMPVAEATERLLASLLPIEQQEIVPLEQASGRILAGACVAPMDVPPFAVSAMDGYALRSSDVIAIPASLKVTQRIPAGQNGAEVKPGEAARIFTGAPLPPAADAVVMQENCTESGDSRISVNQTPEVGENVRPAGDDVGAGRQLLAAGHRLRPQDLALLASVGLDEVAVRRQLKVALLVTGDELVEPGQPLRPGQIYNANLPSLRALLEATALVEVIDLGRAADNLAATRELMRLAAQSADCLISTGGVSVGEEDHVRAALEAEGQVEFWKLALKPGKPFTCGKLGSCQFFGLPGNPVSAFVTFCVLVRPALLTMLGCTRPWPLQFEVAADFSLPRSGERQEYRRVSLTEEKGSPRLQQFANQSSGVSSSLSGSDGLAVVPPFTAVEPGQLLRFIPYSELLS